MAPKTKNEMNLNISLYLVAATILYGFLLL